MKWCVCACFAVTMQVLVSFYTILVYMILHLVNSYTFCVEIPILDTCYTIWCNNTVFWISQIMVAKTNLTLLKIT